MYFVSYDTENILKRVSLVAQLYLALTALRGDRVAQAPSKLNLPVGMCRLSLAPVDKRDERGCDRRSPSAWVG